ncbi:dihydroneopterin aldolase [Rhizorhabdus dicambivorans]|uniref:Acetyltransferase n=1 Tax=Rhizorhabdus dicambivorans TaxID=1850238 RepID=A0A2A4FYI2_9SPHN|nr:dihydroneopterin aldolase [Rhizorhabdus dicambivorans]ATE63637.1 acetyltransferase [Rhizorhabdus dicambivorans]PCE42763.1 acetyltransferase [Rhizorhabdus dicambivorans]
MNEHRRITGSGLHGAMAGLEQTLWVRAERVRLMASVGIYRGEKEKRQEILLDIAAEVPEPEADQIGDTIDYRTLVDQARQLSEEGHFELIETYACELGRRLIALGGVTAVDLELYKPRAIAPAMASVRFRIRKPTPAHDGWRGC